MIRLRIGGAGCLFTVLSVLSLGSLTTGCNGGVAVEAKAGRKTSFGDSFGPMGGVLVSGTYAGPIPGTGGPGSGSQAPWSCKTAHTTTSQNFFGIFTWTSSVFGDCSAGNIATMAEWQTLWNWPQPCYTFTTSPPSQIPLPQSILSPLYYASDPIGNECYISPETNTEPSDATPQVVLDTAFPPTLTLSNLNQITTPPADTYLQLWNNSSQSVINEPAISVNGTSATFPYPTQISGSPLSSGAYLGLVSEMTSSGPTVNFGMQPFFVAHNDTSWPSAFGVVAGNNGYTTKYCIKAINPSTHACIPECFQTNNTGSDYPVVTLPTENEVAIGTAGNTVPVGTLPTAIIAYGAQQFESDLPVCGVPAPQGTTWTGPPNALVVNTGSNNVTLIALHGDAGPTGTVAVGQQPVAAAIGGSGYAYVANYGDGTISEVDLQNVVQTRTLAVGSHPSSLWYDAAGNNLWVGGQGMIAKVSLASWSVADSVPVDGTVTSLILDPSSGNLYHTLLQNGSSMNPSRGRTLTEAIAFSGSSGSSYSTMATYSVNNGVEAVQLPGPDNVVYAESPLASHLVFPGQLALVPPSYTGSSSNGKLIAFANGQNYSVILSSTGQTLIAGSMPSAIRSTAVGANTVYLTLPDSNSVVSIPFSLGQQ